MSRKKRVPPTSIFIACEGKNTEPIYFEKIKEIVEEGFNLAITIYPDKNDETHSSHALGLVEEARSRIGEFDEVWAVFDKNGYTKHKEAFELANQEIDGKRVNIAFSSISFEYWVLLHFERSDVAFPKSKDIIDRLKESEYFPEYEKKTYIDTFSRLQPQTETALENLAWLKYQLTSSGSLPDTPVYQLNPYTDVDNLVRRLLGIETEVIYTEAGMVTTVKDLKITVEYQELTLSVLIDNNSTGQYVFNSNNIEQYLQIQDAGGEVNKFSLVETKLIAPGTQGCLALSVISPLTENRLTFLWKKTKVIIDLK